MNGLVNSLRGYLEIRIEGGSPEWCLNRLTAAQIPFWGMRAPDAFTACIFIYPSDYEAVRNLAERATCSVRIEAYCGVRYRFSGLKKRIVLLCLLAASVLAAIIAPQFVWFFRVEGNREIASERILRAVSDAGITAGIYGPNIDPQAVRYRVLAQIPELEWITVAQNGGCAVISVREKTETPQFFDRKTPRDLVASIGGMITDISALDGSAAVKKGDVVEPEQVLISGRMDLTYAERICSAEGEVFARTWREISAVTPMRFVEKGKILRTAKKYSLRIGKKQIKISPGSGSFVGNCDKMTDTKQFTLPGGFSFPIALVIERYRFYEPTEKTADEADAYALMQNCVEQNVRREMLAGRILKTYLHTGKTDGVYSLRESLECEEMIARPRRMELYKGEDANGRANDQR